VTFFRVIDTGFLVIETGFRVIDTGFLVMDAGFRVSVTGFLEIDIGRLETVSGSFVPFLFPPLFFLDKCYHLPETIC